MTMTMGDLIYYPLVGALHLFQRFRKDHPVGPHKRETRDYEWQADHECQRCELTGRARFIEWVEGAARVTTAECPFCGFETIIE